MADAVNDTLGTDANTVIAPPSTPVSERVLRIGIPVAMLILALLAWQVYVVTSGTPERPDRIQFSGADAQDMMRAYE